MKIQNSGEKLDDDQKAILSNVIAGFHFQNHTELLEINLKTYDKEGNRAKWVSNIRASTDWGLFTAEADDWKLNLSAKQALRKLEEQLEKAKTKR